MGHLHMGRLGVVLVFCSATAGSFFLLGVVPQSAGQFAQRPPPETSPTPPLRRPMPAPPPAQPMPAPPAPPGPEQPPSSLTECASLARVFFDLPLERRQAFAKDVSACIDQATR
jgi:hypothetical protein